MRDAPSIIIGAAGAAFLLGSLAPAAIEARGTAGLVPAMKADRLAEPRPSAERASVSTIEVIGLSQAAVVFKSRDGAVLFRADPAAGTTVLSKDVDLPIVTMKDEPARPAAQPARSRESENPPPRNERKPRIVGCESALSALVRTDASRVPGLCLAQAPGRVPS